jgi:hypothetical protein
MSGLSRALARRTLEFGVLALGVLAPGGRDASAQQPAEAADCGAAYVETQRARRDGRLLDAPGAAVACGQDACTPTMRVDCGRWLEEIERALPSIVVDARGVAGRELQAVRVSSGDRTLATRLDGRAIVLDPGRHAIRVESQGRERTVPVLMREGEKFRMVIVDFEEAAPGARANAPEPAPLPERPGAFAQTPRWVDPLGYALTGVALVALSVTGVLAVSGYAEEQSLRKGCGRTRSCARGDVAAVERLYRGADLSLGIAALSGVSAVGVWTLSGESEAEGPRGLARRAPASGLRTLTLRGRF